MKAVILHSGGLDSTTLIGQAIEEGAEEVLLVSVKYGSLHNDAEALAAHQILEWYREEGIVSIDRVELELPGTIFSGGKSALMGEISMPKMTYKEIQESAGPSPTVVPFRNANLLSIATSIADSRGFDFVYIGAHADDAHEWAYPDCTPEFLGAMANAIFIGTYQKVRLVFPFIWMTKGQIVSRAVEIGVPLGMTWSCYSPRYDGDHYIHCGECPTCIERANAFAEAGFVDPTEYNNGLEYVLDGYSLDDLEEWPYE
jgi:7-cyano-7-deazaguanine synthase